MMWLVVLSSLMAAPARRPADRPATLPALENIAPKKKDVERWQVGAREGGEVEQATPSSIPEAPEGQRQSWLLLVRLGGGIEWESPVAGVVGGGVEFAYRFPFANGALGIGAAMSASGGFGTVLRGDGAQSPSRLFRLIGRPLVSVQPKLGPGLLRFVAGPQLAGTWLSYASSTATGDWSSFSMGAYFSAGYALSLGRTALGVEISYALAPYRVQNNVERLGHELGGNLFLGWSL